MKVRNSLKSHKITILFLVISFFIFPSCSKHIKPTSQINLEQEFLNAVKDAEIVEPNEISKDLIAIVAYNPNLVWKGVAGNKHVLVVTWTSWNGYDDKIGETMDLTRAIWVTTVPELETFCKEHSPAKNNLSLRLEQLLGLPANNGKTRFVEIWADPSDLFRPSPDPEITDHEAELDFPGSEKFVTVSEDHIEWFNDLKSKSYGEGGYPWTRLGYTYDWENPNSEVGLSEFVISEGATVEIHSVLKNEDYCK